MSLSRSELLRRMQALEAEITRLDRPVQAEPPITRVTRETTRLRRLLTPGQILRFPTESDWVSFKEQHDVPEDSYVIIEHTDPLGFDGDSPTFYPDGADNPRNYLRRNQLPSLKIDMTNVYNPTVVGEAVNSEANDYYAPFLGQINEHYFPEVRGDSQATLVQRRFPVIESITPKLVTCKEALERGRQYYNDGGNVSVMLNITDQGFEQYGGNTPTLYLITPPTTSNPIPQSTDCSRPTVGCFWFNDGKNGQIELPKDPDCRAGVIVRFKKYVLL